MTEIVHTHEVHANGEWVGDFVSHKAAMAYVEMQKLKMKGAGLKHSLKDNGDPAAAAKLSWTVRAKKE